jgi:hypothetical protein
MGPTREGDVLPGERGPHPQEPRSGYRGGSILPPDHPARWGPLATLTALLRAVDQRFTEHSAGAGRRLVVPPPLPSEGFNVYRNRCVQAAAMSARDAWLLAAERYEATLEPVIAGLNDPALAELDRAVALVARLVRHHVRANKRARARATK